MVSWQRPGISQIWPTACFVCLLSMVFTFLMIWKVLLILCDVKILWNSDFSAYNSFTGTQPPPFVYIMSMAAFVLQLHSWEAEIETIHPQSLNYLLPGHCSGKAADPWLGSLPLSSLHMRSRCWSRCWEPGIQRTALIMFIQTTHKKSYTFMKSLNIIKIHNMQSEKLS